MSLRIYTDPFCISADAFQPVHTLKEDLSKIKLWVDVTNLVLDGV